MKVGYVALVGRPNVGKSTLLNRLLGQKLSIVSFRPQTTRHRILGIKTVPDGQLIFIDTPGIHVGEKRAMNRYLNQTANAALGHSDVIVWLIDGPMWQAADEMVRKRLAQTETPVILAINKADQLADKTCLLPFMKGAGEKFPFREVIPVSALKGSNVEALERSVFALLPEGTPIYPEDQLSDRPQRFFVAEVIREKLLFRLGQEIPYALTVSIEAFQERQALITIHATIWVEREGQKAIVIGRQGSLLKAVGSSARRDLQAMLEKQVNLQLWVKVREGWSDNDAALRTLGYAE
jgi:GTP-binding protein Era